MKTKIIYTFLIVSFITLNMFAQDPVLKSAFNGKNLKGWVVPENNIF